MRLAGLSFSGLSPCGQQPALPRPPPPTQAGAGPGTGTPRRTGSAVRRLAGGPVEEARAADSRILVQQTLAGLEPLPRVIKSDRSQAELNPGFNRYLLDPPRRGLWCGGARSCRRSTARSWHGSRASSRCSGASSSRSGAWRAATAGSSAATPVFQALATLAWEPRRAAYFRGELFDALSMVRAATSRRDVDDRLVGGRHGPDAVHAVELSEIRRGLRRRRTARHLEAPPTTRSPRSRTISKDSGGTDDETWGREVKVPAAARAAITETIPRRAPRAATPFAT